MEIPIHAIGDPKACQVPVPSEMPSLGQKIRT